MASRRKRDTKKRQGHKFKMSAHRGAGGKIEWDYGPLVPIIRQHLMPSSITLEMTPADVMQAHRKRGECDSRHCAAACMIRRQKHLFGKFDVNGVIEFSKARAMIGIGKIGHYPSKALRFEHGQAWLTELFDTPSGWRKLVKIINDEYDGVLPITLSAYRLRETETSVGKKASPIDGSRSKTFAFRGDMRSMRLDDRSILQAEREANLSANEA